MLKKKQLFSGPTSLPSATNVTSWSLFLLVDILRLSSCRDVAFYPAILLGRDALSEIMENLIMQPQWFSEDCQDRLLHHPTARGSPRIRFFRVRGHTMVAVNGLGYSSQIPAKSFRMFSPQHYFSGILKSLLDSRPGRNTPRFVRSHFIDWFLA